MESQVTPPASAGLFSKVATERRKYQLFILIVALTLAVYAKASISPLQETIKFALNLTDNQLALLQGPTMALPLLIAAIPLGLAVDRYMRVRLLLLFVLLIVIGSVITAFASSFGVLLVARGLVGFAAFALNPVGFSLLADLYEPEQRGRATMMITIGQFAGVAVVFGLGGSLLTTGSASLEPWRWAMLCLTVPMLATVLLIPALREPPRSGRKIVNPTSRDSFIQFWRYRSIILPPMFGMVTAEIALGSVMIWAASALARTFALSADRVGSVMAVAVLVSGVIGTTVGGLLADRGQRTGGPHRTLSLITLLALLTIPAALFALMPTLILASSLLVLLIALLTAILVMGTTLFTVVIPNELRGLCIGVQTAIGAFVGVGLSPLIVSLLSSQLGDASMIGRALTIVCLVSGVLCSAILALGRISLPSRVTW